MNTFSFGDTESFKSLRDAFLKRFGDYTKYSKTKDPFYEAALNNLISALDHFYRIIDDFESTGQNIRFAKFGFQVWNARHQMGFTREEMAQKLKIKLKDYRKIENGEIIPNQSIRVKLSRILNIHFN